MNTFTFILAYRHKIDRISNLKRVLEWILGFNGVEVIVVEQDKSPKLPDFSLKGFKYIFTESNLPFNKSWAFNVALKYASSKIVVFGDSDLIMDPNEFISSLRMLDTYECINPYSKVIDLEPNENQLPIEHLHKISRNYRGEVDIQKTPISGGIIMFRKESIIKIGGFDQNFIGWGGEDDYQSFKIKQLLSWGENDYRCYHLYHDKVRPEAAYYQRNLQLLQKLTSFTKEQTIKYIESTYMKIGLKNSFINK